MSAHTFNPRRLNNQGAKAEGSLLVQDHLSGLLVQGHQTKVTSALGIPCLFPRTTEVERGVLWLGLQRMEYKAGEDKSSMQSEDAV